MPLPPEPALAPAAVSDAHVSLQWRAGRQQPHLLPQLQVQKQSCPSAELRSHSLTETLAHRKKTSFIETVQQMADGFRRHVKGAGTVQCVDGGQGFTRSAAAVPELLPSPYAFTVLISLLLGLHQGVMALSSSSLSCSSCLHDSLAGESLHLKRCIVSW